jgi:hypothetical protein
MKQEKNDLELNQLIKDLDENEKVISKIENENTEVNQFYEKNKKEKPKKKLIPKTILSTKKMRKTQKKLTTKKPKVKNQKTGKKPKIRKSLKYKGKIKKEKLITISKELICIKEENNTQSNSSCQKECIHFESHKKEDLDNSSELEKGSEEMDIKIIIFENKNPDPDPEEPGKIILIKKYEESKQDNKMDDGNSVLSENKIENNIAESLPLQNTIKKLQLDPEKENLNQSGNDSEECFNNIELIPSCDEDENSNLFCEVNFKS